jgi:hypothetical protein
METVNYGRIKFYDTGPRRQKAAVDLSYEKKFVVAYPAKFHEIFQKDFYRGLYYVTSYSLT